MTAENRAQKEHAALCHDFFSGLALDFLTLGLCGREYLMRGLSLPSGFLSSEPKCAKISILGDARL